MILTTKLIPDRLSVSRKGEYGMSKQEKIQQALEATEIHHFPDKFLSTSEKTRLHYFVLTEPAYLDIYPEEGPETRVREGWITWQKPKLITPGYLLQAEGFSENAREALQMLAGEHPDLASIFYKMNYSQKVDEVRTMPYEIAETARRLKADQSEADGFLTAIISGLEEMWDVSLMKFIKEYVGESAQENQVPEMESRGYLTRNKEGHAQVTRTIEGLPIAARDEIEKLFDEVKAGETDPSVLKRELERWGVYRNYEDRFLDLFKNS